MKRLFRVVCAVFAAAALSMGVTAAAVNDVVDMSNSTHGYVTVNYSSSARLKVGIQYNGGKTVFYDCPSGKDASFSLDKGNGKYTVTLYRNVSGTSYQQVESKSMNVTVQDSYAPYLASTSEVQFSKGDTVSAKAAELCKNAKTDEAKVIAIYNYMASRYTYDNKLANEITSGKITKYIPEYRRYPEGHHRYLLRFFLAVCSNVPQPGYPVRTDQGLRRLQLPRLEQGKPERQVVSDRPDLRGYPQREERKNPA